MATDLLDPPETTMAKADNPTVKLPADLHRMVKHVTNDSGEGITKYLDRLLRPLVERDYIDFQRKIAAELGKPPAKKRKD